MDQRDSGAGEKCEVCDGELGPSYFTINGRGVCEGCRKRMSGSYAAGLGLGLLATIGCAGLYYGVLQLAHFRFALIPIVAGVAVSLAVRKGAGYDASPAHRLTAVALTYLCVAASYTHSVLDGSELQRPAEALVASLFLPARMAIEGKNVVTLILLGMGLVEAWRLSAPPRAVVEGPFERAPGNAISSAG